MLALGVPLWAAWQMTCHQNVRMSVLAFPKPADFSFSFAVNSIPS